MCAPACRVEKAGLIRQTTAVGGADRDECLFNVVQRDAERGMVGLANRTSQE
jgi:hypothetical protein